MERGEVVVKERGWMGKGKGGEVREHKAREGEIK